MTKQIKFGIMGGANIAERMVIPAIVSCPNSNLSYISSRTEEKAKKLAKKFSCDYVEGYDQLLKKDIDAVYIPLPTELHYQWAKKSLEAGKHVLVEKSLTTEFGLAQDLVSIATANRLMLMENFQFQYHSQHQKIKELIAAGEIGDIRCFRSSFGFPPFKDVDNIRYSKSLGGGALLDTGAYTLKATWFILGSGFKVKAALLNYPPPYQVDIHGAGLLVNESGISSQVSFGFDHYYQCNYEIWGNKGKLISERAFTAGPGVKPKVILEKQDERHEYLMDADNHFINLIGEFCQGISEADFEKEYLAVLEQARLINEFKLMCSAS